MASAKPGAPLKPPRPVGRPKNGHRERFSLECRLRAKIIYQESASTASPAAIAAQLKAEGFDPTPKPEDISAWKTKSPEWSKPVHSPLAADISEDVRQAVQLRMPDDLDRIERSSVAFELLTQHCATWLKEQVANIKVETPEQFEIMTRCLREMTETHLSVTKSLVDLRRLRVSSFSGYGEIIPPSKPEAVPVPTEQERIISNFR